MSAPEKLHIMIVAGEPSGDVLGAELMEAFGKIPEKPELHFSGIGGQEMEKQGLQSLFPMSEISHIGVTSVLARIVPLLARIRQTAEHAIKKQPDIVVMIDSPDFTHRVAKHIRKYCPELPIIDYVAPSVWAWREGRIAKMRNIFSHILSVFPFEPDFFANHNGPPCSYIGHSALQKIQNKEAGKAFRLRHDIGEKETLLALLPGSRKSEVESLLPVFLKTIEQLPAVKVLLITPVSLPASIEKKIGLLPLHIIHADERYEAFAASNLALAASGTVALELALARIPMVIAYKMSFLNQFLLSRLASIPSVVLPNLIVGKPIIEEFLGRRCKPNLICHSLLQLMEDKKHYENCLKGLDECIAHMQTVKPPSLSAAEKILEIARH
ncbi:MAG: lipid-A-disaccharide synthase [Parvibaculales bacterium]